MKLIVTEEDLILDTQEGTYTVKRTFEEDEWHVITEFVDLNFFYDADEDKYHAAIYLVLDGQTQTHTEHKIEVEFA
jgi:hypothetical protein